MLHARELLAARGQLDLEAAVEGLDLAFASAQLGEQPRVLDGDGRLIGDVDHEPDVVVVEHALAQAVVGVDRADGATLDDERHGQHGAQVKVGDRERLPKARVAGGVDRHDGLAARGGPARDRARELELLRLERLLVDVARDLDDELARIVLEQQEAALGVGELDHRVDDELEQSRQAQLAVESLVDAQEPPQARLGGGRAGRERDVATGGERRGWTERAEPGRVGIGVETGTVVLRAGHADLLENRLGERL